MIKPTMVLGKPSHVSNMYAYEVLTICPRCGYQTMITCHHGHQSLELLYEIDQWAQDTVIWSLRDQCNIIVQHVRHCCQFLQNYARNDHQHVGQMPSRDDEIISLLQQIKRTGIHEDVLRAQIALLNDQLEFAHNDLAAAQAKIKSLEADLLDVRAAEEDDLPVRQLLGDS